MAEPGGAHPRAFALEGAGRAGSPVNADRLRHPSGRMADDIDIRGIAQRNRDPKALAVQAARVPCAAREAPLRQ